MLSDGVLVNLRMKKGETKDEFIKRMQARGYREFNESAFQRWDTLTKGGTQYGGPALMSEAKI